jgi:Uncharacterized protein conserved in bacteria (DUF2188)
MANDSHHVVPSSEGGWDVKRSNAERASRHFETKQEAVDWGRQVSTNQQTEFIIHTKDRRIQNPDSHGNDPFPPRDQK